MTAFASKGLLVFVKRTDGSGGVWFSPQFVCLFLRTISQKPMQLGSSDLTPKCSTMSPGNAFIFD